MRIDLTPQGQVVGTRKVSENGQVAGLSEHAGKEVLILVPNGRPIVKNTIADYVHEWQRIAERNAKRARQELRALQKRMPRTGQEALTLARHQLEYAQQQLALERLVKAKPVVRARRTVEKRIKRAQKQVLEAQTWLRARIPANGKKAPSKSKARAARAA